jgi:hypothetical protein
MASEKSIQYATLTLPAQERLSGSTSILLCAREGNRSPLGVDCSYRGVIEEFLGG